MMMKAVRVNGGKRKYSFFNSELDLNESSRGKKDQYFTVSSIEKLSQIEDPFIHHLSYRLNWNSI